MSPRTEMEYERLRMERRNHIMDVALGLFAEEGYHQTSISKIATSASISKGLIYNYFESKEALLQSIIEKGLELFSGSFDPDRDEILNDEEFGFLIEETFHIIRKNQQFLRLYMSVMAQPEVLRLVQSRFEAFYDFFIRILSNYFASKGKDNPRAEARLFGAFWDGMILHYLVFKDYPLEETKQVLIKRFK